MYDIVEDVIEAGSTKPTLIRKSTSNWQVMITKAERKKITIGIWKRVNILLSFGPPAFSARSCHDSALVCWQLTLRRWADH